MLAHVDQPLNDENAQGGMKSHPPHLLYGLHDFKNNHFAYFYFQKILLAELPVAPARRASYRLSRKEKS